MVQRLHSPGSQLWHGLPALAQGQLCEKQEAATEQKQQRYARASISFGHLLPPCLGGVRLLQTRSCSGGAYAL